MNQEEIVAVSNILWMAMKERGAIAVSAPQLGIDQRLIVLASGDVLMEPTIVNMSDEAIELEETDIRYPGAVVKRWRAPWIRVRYTDGKGAVGTSKFEGLTARLIQQHMDILNGVSFFEGLSSFHREKIEKQIKKVARIRKAVKRLGVDLDAMSLLHSSLSRGIS